MESRAYVGLRWMSVSLTVDSCLLAHVGMKCGAVEQISWMFIVKDDSCSTKWSRFPRTLVGDSASTPGGANCLLHGGLAIQLQAAISDLKSSIAFKLG